MSEWRYECPNCGGKFYEWAPKKGTMGWACPFCGIDMFSHDPNKEIKKIDAKPASPNGTMPRAGSKGARKRV